MDEVYKQAGSGGVLLSAMGNPREYPVYWDKILLNASQVTNPPIDPLREPMETKTFLGKKDQEIHYNENGKAEFKHNPYLELDVHITTQVRAVCTRISTSTVPIPSARWLPDVSAYSRNTSTPAPLSRSRWVRVLSPVSADTSRE